jgi:hypothetical protein
MGDSPAIELEVKHYAAILRQTIRAAGFSVSEVERRLGAGPKSLRRVFGGQVDLKFKHVVAVLRVIGMSQAQFFDIASRRRRRRSPGGELLASFERKRSRGPLPPAGGGADQPASPGSDEELDRMVEDAVARVIERRAGEGMLRLPAGLPFDEEGVAERLAADASPRPPEAGPGTSGTHG